LFYGHVDLEDGFKNHRRCRHRHPIHESGNPERPKFSIRLRYPDPADRLRSIRLAAECVRQFVEPSFLSIRLDVRKILTIYPWCAVVGFAPLVRIGQHVFAIHLVVQ
jgi:hypothetical protein